MTRFLSLYPEISVDVSVDRGITDIVAGSFDAGIRPGESIARDMIAMRISDEMPFVVAASPLYLRDHGTPKAQAACVCEAVGLMPRQGFAA